MLRIVRKVKCKGRSSFETVIRLIHEFSITGSITRQLLLMADGGDSFLFSVSVQILANKALRAHHDHASAHGGLSANVLSDICLIFLK